MSDPREEDNRDIFEKVADSTFYKSYFRPAVIGAAGGYALVGGGRKIDKLLRKKKNPLPRYERQVKKAQGVGAASGALIGVGMQNIADTRQQNNPRRR